MCIFSGGRLIDFIRVVKDLTAKEVDKTAFALLT